MTKIRLKKGQLIRVAGANTFHGWPNFANYDAEVELTQDQIRDAFVRSICGPIVEKYE